MLHVDDAACDDENKNDFTEVSAGNDVIHPDRLLVSWRSASESDNFELLKTLQVYRLLIYW